MYDYYKEKLQVNHFWELKGLSNSVIPYSAPIPLLS